MPTYTVLQKSGAKNIQNANLIERAKKDKKLILCLRNKVKKLLKTVPQMQITDSQTILRKVNAKKVQAIQQINKTIENKYPQVITNISQFCEDVMGKPPCQYTIVGLGSLAREEITPYSDFEHIILLCDDKNYKLHLEYFKWFSVIFHVVILNFQETIVPSLNICSLNDQDFSLGDWYYDAITP